LFRSLMENGESDRAEKIRNLVLPGESIQYARNVAADRVARARQALACLHDSPALRLLDAMAEFVVSREV
jgi:geranylgeranyl pyrophosphate synthase